MTSPRCASPGHSRSWWMEKYRVNTRVFGITQVCDAAFAARTLSSGNYSGLCNQDASTCFAFMMCVREAECVCYVMDYECTLLITDYAALYLFFLSAVCSSLEYEVLANGYLPPARGRYLRLPSSVACLQVCSGSQGSEISCCVT